MLLETRTCHIEGNPFLEMFPLFLSIFLLTNPSLFRALCLSPLPDFFYYFYLFSTWLPVVIHSKFPLLFFSLLFCLFSFFIQNIPLKAHEEGINKLNLNFSRPLAVSICLIAQSLVGFENELYERIPEPECAFFFNQFHPTWSTWRGSRGHSSAVYGGRHPTGSGCGEADNRRCRSLGIGWWRLSQKDQRR